MQHNSIDLIFFFFI